MARKGRKQLAVQIKDESFIKLEQIKEDLGLSNAKIIEMLIENYTNTSTNTEKPHTNTCINTTEEMLRKILKEELAYINTSININTKPAKSINTITAKNKVIPAIEPGDDDDVPAFSSSSEDIQEWQKKPIDPQSFYGKVPEVPRNDTPMEWKCESCNYEWKGVNGDIICPKCDSVYIDEKEKPFNPFL